jgi:hypothetical protein
VWRMTSLVICAVVVATLLPVRLED